MIRATPTYFQLPSESIANGASVVYVPLDENYVIDLQSISEAITDSTRLISLVNPNNPVATIINKSDMEAFLNSLRREIIVVIDEAYHHSVHSITWDGKDVTGRMVASGVYIINLIQGELAASNRATLVK